jgi:hypothetical protein
VSGGDGATEDGNQQQTFTISNDDSATVTIADVAVNENAGTATVTLTLDNAVDGGFDVDASTADGAATTADSDYTAVTGATQTFAGTAGETQTFTITLGGDAKVEADETLSVSMSNLVPVTVSSGDITTTDTATVTLTNDDNATVTIADVGGNEDDGAITVTLTLDNAVDGGFDVDVSTADGTATLADSDYTAVVNQTLTFAGTQGESQTFTITPTADVTSEANETVFVSMSNLVGATVASGDLDITDGATVTITNDDSISITVDDPSVAENTGTLSFTVSLSTAAPTGGATVDFATSNGTAMAGSDYTAASGTVSFAVGETSKTVDVTLSGDSTVEVDETLTLTLSNPTGTSVTIGDATGAGTISNDDSATVTIADIAVNENAGTATVTLTLDSAVDGGFDVDVSTSDGTATTADSDYTAVVNATETFAGTAGETQTFTITLGGDAKVEADETLSVSMSNLVPARVSSGNITITDTATLTLTNDDSATLSIADISALENGTFTLTVSVDNAVDGGFSVDLATSDGTAVAPGDYTALSGATLTFSGTASEQRTQVLTVTNDSQVEADETLTVSLGNVVAGTVDAAVITSSDTGVVTIENDDAPLVTLNAINPNPVAEANQTATIEVGLTVAALEDTVVTLGFTGTATWGGVDYTLASTSVTILAGQTSASTTLTTVQDTLYEPVSETIIVDIAGVTGGNGASESGVQQRTVSILDDDGAPTLSIVDVTLGEGASGATAFDFTVSLSNASSQTVSARVDTADGTAVSGSDYTAVSGGTVTFTPGQTSQTVSVQVSGDGVVELDETFTVTLSSPVNATITDAEATGTITNDDSATISIADVSRAEGDAGASVFAFAVSLSAPSDQPVSFTASTADGAATAGSDYTALSAAPFTIAAGDTSATLGVLVSGDAEFETDETFTVTLAGLAASGRDVTIADAEGTGTITNDDGAPRLSLSSPTVGEDAGTAVVRATLDASAGVPVSFRWSTGNGTASAPDDFTAISAQPVTIAAGQTHVDLAVSLVDDAIEELAETFTVSITHLAPALVADTGATVTIEASDIAAPEPTLSADGGLVSGAFTVRVSFTEPVTGLALDDFGVTNAVLSDLQGSGEAYTLTAMPGGDGTVTVSLPAGAAADAVGAVSTASAPLSVEADLTSPGVELTTQERGVISGVFQVTITFSEAVTGFELTDIGVGNGAASDLATSDAKVFTATITPTGDGAVTVSLAAGAAQDAAGNASTAAEPLVVEADSTPPGVAITLPGAETTGAFTARFTFTEAVAGFELADIGVVNGAASDLATSDDTVFTAIITPQAPGAVTVSLAESAASDAGGNASLAASAAIEAVSVSEGVVLVLGASVADPGSVAATTLVTNPGSDPLSFTAAADVDWIEVTPGSGLVTPLGALDLQITLNDAVNALAAGEYVGTVTVRVGAGAAPAGELGTASSHGAVLVEIPVSLQLQARFGALTLVAVTPSGASGEASFTYASDIDALDALTLTTRSGRASVSEGELLSGQYQLTQSLPAGWRVESISCAGDIDGGSSFDIAAGAASIDLDADESLVCTFENVRDEDVVRLATQRAIRNFMVRRADRIIEAAPDLSRRFEERATIQRGSMGADVDGAGRYQMSFTGSLSGLRNASAGHEGAARFTNPERAFLEGWDVWLTAEVSGVSDDRAGERADSDFGVAQLGVDYQLSDTLIVGALAQYDWMSESAQEIFQEAGAVRGARVEGEGWMAGPYAVWRIADALILDGLVLYGRSDNQVDPLGLYEDDFETERFMVRGNLTGEFVSGAWRLRPQAGLTHFEETQSAYTDSLGIVIPEQTLALGRLRAGPQVAWRQERAQGGWLELSTAFNAVWDYQAAELLNEAGLAVGGDEDLRIDARFAVSAQTRRGALIRLETGLDGLGVGDFQARTARFEISIPFGAAGRGGANRLAQNQDATRTGGQFADDTTCSTFEPSLRQGDGGVDECSPL